MFVNFNLEDLLLECYVLRSIALKNLTCWKMLA